MKNRFKNCCLAKSTVQSLMKSSRLSSRRGVTLIELMVAVTLSLLLIFAVVQIFDVLGKTVTNSRALLELSGQMRTVSNRLQLDLDNVTLRIRPGVDDRNGLGYFEYIDGPMTDSDLNANGLHDVIAVDSNPSAAATPIDSDGDGLSDIDEARLGTLPGNPNSDTTKATLDGIAVGRGDIDDILMMTVNAPEGVPFVGRIFDPVTGTTQLIESDVAEVIYWIGRDARTPNDLPNQLRTNKLTLYRRVLLIRPDLDLSAFADDGSSPMPQFFHQNDISARINPANNRMIANSLADLGRRQNRFGRWRQTAVNFPHGFPDILRQDLSLAGACSISLSGGYYGEDVLLSDVLAFDVRAYDAMAPMQITGGGFASAPGDLNYVADNSSNIRGGYVDLNYARAKIGSPLALASPFSTSPNPFSRLSKGEGGGVYCTWPLHYERDGIDQNNTNGPDEGFDGIDNNESFGVDDVTEREARAPYSEPLRGIEVRIRLMEPGTKQVRQVSVVADFMPE